MLDNIPLSYYAVSSLFNFVTSFLLLIFVFFRNPKSYTNQTFSLWAFTVAGWSLCYFFWLSAENGFLADFFLRTLMLFVIFIPSTFTHFILTFVKKDYDKRINLSNYFISFCIGCTVYTQFFATDMGPFLVFPYWLKPKLFFIIHAIHFFVNTIYSHFLMLRVIRNRSGIFRNQVLYVFIGTAIGYIAGVFNYFTWFRLPITPFLCPLVSVYVFTIAFAIIRYRLLDIHIIITRASIFLVVYTIILGIPIWVGLRILGYGLWLFPIALMGFFATAGPFIYLFIQKKAEDALLQEQHRYQSTLRRASTGMGKIKDLNKLLNLIVFIVTRSVQIEHALVYLYDERNKNFNLVSHKRRSGHVSFLNSFSSQNPMISLLRETSKPIIYDELKQKSQDLADEKLIEIEQFIAQIQGALVFPVFTDNNLTAIIVLGKKESGKLYSDDDLSVFTILANQAGLAIENAKFYEDVTRTHEQLYHAEKMATIGTMADGLSHQINNRFHALGFIASDALDTINISKNQQDPQKFYETMVDLERALKRIQENVVQGGEVVQGLLRYTRKGDAGMTVVNFDKVLTAAYEMAQFKIKSHELKILRDYDVNQIPKIKGNFAQLQEVFFNLIDNAYDAMMQRKTEQSEPGFQPTLKINIGQTDNIVNIVFEDNGIGVKEEDFNKLFTPFFTTKLSSKKGTGLGLYVIKKIIEENHNGKVDMISTYMQGTKMVLDLPVAYE